jgi:isocitrate dehydrogenase
MSAEIYRPINTPEELTEDVLMIIETIYEGYYADEKRIDWFTFLDRVERMGLYNLGSEMDSSVVKAIKKYVRKIKAEQ